MFLLERYVFLEPGMEMKKQRFFYLISASAVLFIYVFFGKDAATLVTLIAGGLNISLARKEHRLRGFFLIVPLPGIIDGFVIPILVILLERKELAFMVSDGNAVPPSAHMGKIPLIYGWHTDVVLF